MIAGGRWTAWPAPAKLNLFLHIVGRRADGYHRLQTVFRLLDWGDTVRVRLREDGRIERVSGAPGVPPERDIAVRAAQALKAATGTPFGVDLAIDKRIPIAAGLGGGSSDAATVLVVLNELWRTGLDRDRLAAIGLALGADVPLFVRGHSAFAEGVGEILAPLPLPEAWYVVLDAGCEAATPELFQAPDLTRNAEQVTIHDFLSGRVSGNVFEPVVRRRCPAVASALDWLRNFGTAGMSGSGGAVFLDAGNEARAREVALRCPAGFIAHVARGVDVSPLERALGGTCAESVMAD